MLKATLPALATVLTLAYSAPSTAGAWLRAEGEWLLSTSVATSSANSSWDDNRKRSRDACTTTRQSLDVYSEYGYSYYHTLFASAGLADKQCRGEDGASGLSDLTVGIRGRLDPFRNGRSWEIALKLPISGNTADSERPGNGEVGIDAGVHFRLAPDPYEHQVISYRGGIWNWGAGIRAWTGGLAHQAWTYGGWSRSLDNGWGISTQLSATLSFGGRTAYSDGSKDNDYDKLVASFGVRKSLTRDIGVSVSVSKALWGRNADQDLGLRIGISRMWR